MNYDEMQKAWQAAQTRVSIDADLLLKEVQRNQRSFRATIFCRDVREIGTALLLVPVWIFLGIYWSSLCTWHLGVPALLWIAGFMLVDRRRQRRHESTPGDTLRRQIESSLAQVEHQIWLLRNIFWWYLLPPGAAIAIFFAHSGWERGNAGIIAPIAVVALVYWGIYWLNIRCVRRDLDPRRTELKALLASLTDAPHPQDIRDASTDEAPAAKPARAAWIWIVLLCAAVLAVIAVGNRMKNLATGSSGQSMCPAAGDAAVTNILVPIRQKHRVPAIAAALVTSDGLVAVGVAGVRKQGTEIPVTLEDKWHLGSNGKAMTAVLVARLVERGLLNWDTSVAEVFPELASRFHPDASRITVIQLLTHRSGLRANPNLRTYGGADGTKERLRLVENELARRPSQRPGRHYEYSNLGYSIIGAITEKITGRTWEEAMQEEVFGPLGMTSAGFGGTGSPGEIDQPWGHTKNGKPVRGNGPAMDNPPVLGPAGRIHCTIHDWAKFIADQLRGARGEAALLKPETYRTLHTPPADADYALGWAVRERPWGGGTVLQHTGDNTMNFANVWVAPRRNFAILACVNQSGDTAFTASDDAIGELIKFHLQRVPAPSGNQNR